MIDKLNTILKKLKIPFERNEYKGKEEIYIVWSIYTTKFSNFKDNKASEKIEYVVVNIYSKKNYQHIKEKLINEFNNSEDFTLLGIESEDYEEDTGYYHCPINIAYV